MEIKIIAGLSGAGKSTAIKNLEDIGYFSIDNLPPALIGQFLNLSENSTTPMSKIAIGVDVRSLTYYEEIEEALANLMTAYPSSELFFLDASDEELIKRFKETRRLHPLSFANSLIDGINLEREKMAKIKKMASIVIDTSSMTARQLGQHIKKIIIADDSNQISIMFRSFGFKKGLPIDSDLVLDVRFLPNPYYDENLRELTGNDKAIHDYVFKWEESQLFYKKLCDMLDFLLPQYMREGKNMITIAIGCTGGRHRSVALVNQLAKDYQGQDYLTMVVHRDL